MVRVSNGIVLKGQIFKLLSKKLGGGRKKEEREEEKREEEEEGGDEDKEEERIEGRKIATALNLGSITLPLDSLNLERTV